MNMNRKNIIKLFLSGAMGLAIAGGFFSCGKSDLNSPGNEFMPDMYRSPSLEVYNYIVTRGGDTLWSARQPVTGTISRDNMPGLPPAITYEQSGGVMNPLPNVNNKEMFNKYSDQGKEIYAKFCVHCHGATGGGDGKVAAKLPGPPPAYSSGALKDLPAGKIFYSISNGKGMMGPHAPLLSVEERWKLVCYVQALQGPKTADTTAAATPAPAAAINNQQ